MANEWAKIDQNNRRSLIAVADSNGEIRRLLVDDQGRLLVTGTISDFSFLDLSDTPNSYAGQAGNCVVVNGTEDGLEFVACGTGDTFLALTDTPAAYTGAGGFFVSVNAGETALVFTDPGLAAGGGYDAVVCGAGGTPYATVKEAVDDGKERILVVCDTTEIANIDIVAATQPNMLITIVPGVTVNMGAFRFTDTGTLNSFTMNGGGKIVYAHTVANEELFDFVSPTSYLDINNLIIDNNSSANGCQLFAFNNARISMDNVRLELPNQAICGIQNTFGGSNLSNITLVGGGAACEDVTDIEDANLIGWILTGVFIDSAAGDVLFAQDCTVSDWYLDFSAGPTKTRLLLTNCVVSNVIQGTTSLTCIISQAWSVTNASTTFASAIDLNAVKNVSNCSLGSGICTVGNVSNAKYSNVYCEELSGFNIGGDVNSVFVNVEVGSGAGAVSMPSDRCLFTNCIFEDGLTVTTNANDSGFTNCRFGPEAGGGATTLTIAAGANRTRVIGCMSDAAISDAGTGTVLLGNTVY